MFNPPYTPKTSKTFAEQNNTPQLQEKETRKYFNSVGIDTQAVYKSATDTIRGASNGIFYKTNETELKEAFQILKDLGTQTINTKWLNYGYQIQEKNTNKKLIKFLKECEQKGYLETETNKTTHKQYMITA